MPTADYSLSAGRDPNAATLAVATKHHGAAYSTAGYPSLATLELVPSEVEAVEQLVAQEALVHLLANFVGWASNLGLGTEVADASTRLLLLDQFSQLLFSAKSL